MSKQTSQKSTSIKKATELPVKLRRKCPNNDYIVMNDRAIKGRFYHKELEGYFGGEMCRCKGPDRNYSTGYAYKDKVLGPWLLEFQCSRCHEFSRRWSKEYMAAVEKILQKDSPEIETDYQER